MDFELFVVQVQNLPIDIFEKIRRLTYKTQSSELLEDISGYRENELLLHEECKKRQLPIYCAIGLIKYLDSNNVLRDYQYTVVRDYFLRYYKYKEYKYFRVVETIQCTYSFRTFWGILTNKERLNIINYINIKNY